MKKSDNNKKKSEKINRKEALKRIAKSSLFITGLPFMISGPRLCRYDDYYDYSDYWDYYDYSDYYDYYYYK